MLGASNRSDLAGMSPARRFVEKSRRYHTEQRHIERRRALLREEAPAEGEVKKGHCRHCGEHVGRGVAFHERACPRSPTS